MSEIGNFLHHDVIFFDIKNHQSTVVGETLAVFRLPQIRKNGQCLDGQVGKTFLEIFGGNNNFSNVLSENLGFGF